MLQQLFRKNQCNEWKITSNVQINYSIIDINDAFLTNKDEFLEKALKSVLRCFIVIDEEVAKLYLSKIRHFFINNMIAHKIFIFKSGEHNKNIFSCKRLIFALEEFGLFRRSEPIIAIGGGVLTDMAGFVASIYRRGVPCIKIPTTLMGYVDACIGIKTGINIKDKKNRIGTFAAPTTCILDRSFLGTLDRRHITNGACEIFKLAVIKNKELFDLLEKEGAEGMNNKFQDRGEKILEYAITSMLEELEPNLFEENLLRVADFGHTFSLCIELDSNSKILHGEAVSMDIALCTVIAYQRKLLTNKEFNKIISLMKKLQLPICPPVASDILFKSLEERVEHRDGYQRVPLPHGIGDSIFVNDITLDEINIAMEVVKSI